MIKKIIIVSGIIVLIDQLIKYFVGMNLPDQSISIIPNFFSLVYTENTGAAWGILTGTRWFLIIISLVAIYTVVKYFLLDINITKLEFIAYSLVLGGIVGNLIDRLVHGYVIDYLAFTFGNYDFPIFNLADSCIVVGVSLVVMHLILNAIRKKGYK